MVMRSQPMGRTATTAPPAPVTRVTTTSQAPSRQPVVYLSSPRAALPPVVWGAAWGWPLGYFGTGPYLMTFFLPDADATAPTRSRALAAEPGELIVADLSESSTGDEAPTGGAAPGPKVASVTAP